jgi:HK97 gp10 family phage protein
VQEGARRRSRVDTGELRDSWAVAFTGPTDGEVFSDSDHAVYNEYGTVNMSAQPMLHPAIDEERPKYIAALANILSDLG